MGSAPHPPLSSLSYLPLLSSILSLLSNSLSLSSLFSSQQQCVLSSFLPIHGPAATLLAIGLLAAAASAAATDDRKGVVVNCQHRLPKERP